MAIEAPRLPHHHFPTPAEVLKGMGRETVEAIKWVGHTKTRLALAALAGVTSLGGAYGLYLVFRGSAGETNTTPPSQPGAAEPQRPPEVGLGVEITPYPTSTPEPKTTATPTPPPIETPAPKIRPLTPDTRVISAETVDIVGVDIQEIQRLYQKSVAEGKNKIPIPVDLGKTGEIVEYVLPNGIHGLLIKNLPVGKTYNFVAPVDGKADGSSREDNKKYSPNSKATVVNFYPNSGIYKTQRSGCSFPLNATIVPKFWASNDQPRDNFRAGEILATFTVNPSDLPEQQDFEKMWGEYGKGANMACGVSSPTGGANKEPISMPDVFLTNTQGQLVYIN